MLGKWTAGAEDGRLDFLASEVGRRARFGGFVEGGRGETRFSTF